MNPDELRREANRLRLVADLNGARGWENNAESCRRGADALDRLAGILDREEQGVGGLREHDAKLIEGLADEVKEKRNEPGLVHLAVKYAGYYNGIRSGLESSEKILREKARQRREEQS